MGAVAPGSGTGPPTWHDFPRPTEGYYEERFPWLSQGDIFPAVPVVLLGRQVATVTAEGPAFLLPASDVPVMLTTPTCDFRRLSANQLAQEPDAEPYSLQPHVRVSQIKPLSVVEASFSESARENNLRLIREFDSLRRYMYLPGREGLPEAIVDLGFSWMIEIDWLLQANRLTQLTFVAARQLWYDLILYEAGVVTNRNQLNPPMD